MRADGGKTRNELNALAGLLRRWRKSGGGRNAGASRAAALRRFEAALRGSYAIEQELGVQAAAPFSDWLQALRYEAVYAGLLDRADVLAIERKVIV